MTGDTIGLEYLLGLCGLIVVGAVVPVIPTGALVSVAGALAERDNLVLIALVVVFGGVGAYLGDLGTYGVLRSITGRISHRPGRLTSWLDKHRQGDAFERFRRQLDEHEVRTLLLSRLVPGGQIPVLVAAAVNGYRWRRFAVADIAAALLWSAMYAATGMAGRAVFPEQWEGIVAGVGLVLLFSLLTNLLSHRHHPLALRLPVPADSDPHP